ncbi:KR domain-containing protein [Aspergillus foveolatus]|uniref:KR domain-containing protein n=1 Tax=Aspergillus foveolatus TaxID=210207 RepID=UPI003CCD3B51
MDPFRKNLVYAAVDIDLIGILNKPLLGRLLRESFGLVSTGKIKPPYPITKVAFSDAQKAFRMLQMGTNMGKVILVPGADDIVPVLPPTYNTNKLLFNTAKTYLIVGGLGGIGRRLSEWMFQRGARRLAFLARSGAEREEARATIAWLRERNVDVSVFKGDVADLAVVQHCINTLGKTLAGIIQAAMVLADAPLATMSHTQWHAAVQPKVFGTYNLHLATHDRELDFFLTFSSIAAVIGSKGQANYSAANCYLDALMRHRRAQGLPGTTINISAVGEVGVIAENAVLEKVMERMGYESITEDELFWAIEEGIFSTFDATQEADGVQQHQIITGLNLQRKDLYWANKSLMRNLYAHLDGGHESPPTAPRQNIALSIQRTSSVEERIAILTAAFTEKVADVLFVPVSTIHSSNALSSYGLDSIIAVEFRTWFLKTVKVDVSLFDILAAKSIEALVEKVVGTIPIIHDTKPHAGGQVDTAANPPPSGSQDIYGPEVNARDEGKGSDSLKKFIRPDRIPLSPLQMHLWSAHKSLDDKSALNLVVLWSLNGQPNPEILQKTVLELTKRNDCLRTRYLDGPDFPEQALSENVAPEFSYHDLSQEMQPEGVLQARVQLLRLQVLDIEQGENIAMGLFKLAEDRFSFITVFHHICIDNGSTKATMSQFISIYNALSRGDDLSTVPSPSVTYSDFSLWYNQRLHTPPIQSSIAWWRAELRNAPRYGKLLPFARANGRPANAFRGRTILRQFISQAKLKRMKRICTNRDATPFHFLVACLRAFIYRYTHERDWILLTMNGNRPHPDLDGVIGFFVNIVPFRFRTACEGRTFEDLLAEARNISLDALAHSQVPFDMILDACNIDRSTTSHHPLGQVFVNYKLNGAVARYSTDHFVVEGLVVEDMPTAGELALEAVEDGQNGLRLRLEYDSFLYSQIDMEVFFGQFTTFLLSVIQDYRVLV